MSLILTRSPLSLLFTLFASYVLRIMQTIKQSLSATKLKGCHPISENKRNFIWNILEWQQETCWLVLNLSTPYLNKYLFTAVCIHRKIVRKAKQNQMIAFGVRWDVMKWKSNLSQQNGDRQTEDKMCTNYPGLCWQWSNAMNNDQWSPPTLTHYQRDSAEREQGSGAELLSLIPEYLLPDPCTLIVLITQSLDIRPDIQSCHATILSLVSANLMEYYVGGWDPGTASSSILSDFF